MCFNQPKAVSLTPSLWKNSLFCENSLFSKKGLGSLHYSIYEKLKNYKFNLICITVMRNNVLDLNNLTASVLIYC